AVVVRITELGLIEHEHLYSPRQRHDDTRAGYSVVRGGGVGWQSETAVTNAVDAARVEGIVRRYRALTGLELVIPLNTHDRRYHAEGHADRLRYLHAQDGT